MAQEQDKTWDKKHSTVQSVGDCMNVWQTPNFHEIIGLLQVH